MLEGRSPLPSVGDIEDPARAIAGFLGVSRLGISSSTSGPERVLATILFTDVGGSTERAAAIGDRAWHEQLDRHHEAVRASVARLNGREIDTAGDVFLVLFDRPGPAIHAAEAIITAVRGLGLATGSG